MQLNALINGTDAKLSFVHKCVLGTASLLGLSEVICAVQEEIKKSALIDISDKLFRNTGDKYSSAGLLSAWGPYLLSYSPERMPPASLDPRCDMFQHWRATAVLYKSKTTLRGFCLKKYWIIRLSAVKMFHYQGRDRSAIAVGTNFTQRTCSFSSVNKTIHRPAFTKMQSLLVAMNMIKVITIHLITAAVLQSRYN